MKNQKKYAYTLQTLSSVIVSPREQSAFYLEVNVKAEDIPEISGLRENVNIIYPFYQYGRYETYDPGQAQYYLPGSSIKGAIQCPDIMADDIKIKSRDLELRNLFKVQHIPGEKDCGEKKKMKFEVFFPNVAVEMLRAGAVCQGEIFSETDIRKILRKSQETARRKIGQLQHRIETLYESVYGQGKKEETEHVDTECKNALFQAKTKLRGLMEESAKYGDETFLLILGGYKGLLLSKDFQNKEVDLGGIYIDEQVFLPHGLCRIQLERSCDE